MSPGSFSHDKEHQDKESPQKVNIDSLNAFIVLIVSSKNLFNDGEHASLLLFVIFKYGFFGVSILMNSKCQPRWIQHD
jgi:hypothetical protein